MKAQLLPLALGCLSLALFPLAAMGGASDNQYVYADFEEVADGRPVSNNGGLVEITSYAQTPTLVGRFKGLADANPPTPELVRIKPDDPNHAATFQYELPVPNDYCGVTLQVHGHPDADGHTVSDDLSAYKKMSVQVYATGVTGMRVELVSIGTGLTKGNDSATVSGFPQKTFKLGEGLNTYKIELKTLKQPAWQQAFRVGVDDVLKELTAVHLSVFCENGCKPTSGMVVVDNIVFEK